MYRAFDERLQRRWRSRRSPAPDAGRVLREAQAAARLNHPGIVTLYELGSEGGSALLVTELVDGATLAELAAAAISATARSARSAPTSARRSATPTTRGVVHRDIKPQNVIVAPRTAPGAGRS